MVAGEHEKELGVFFVVSSKWMLLRASCEGTVKHQLKDYLVKMLYRAFTLLLDDMTNI